MHLLKVGDLYNPARRRWPEAITYTYRGGEHEMLLFFASPTASEVAGLAQEDSAIALFVQQPAIVLAYRVGPDGGTVIPWGDAIFTMHLVPNAERKIPPVDEEQAVFRTVLVDADTGIVRALRLHLLPAKFTSALHAALHEQVTAPWDQPAYERKVAELQAAFTSEDFARAASHIAHMPRRGPRNEA